MVFVINYNPKNLSIFLNTMLHSKYYFIGIKLGIKLNLCSSLPIPVSLKWDKIIQWERGDRNGQIS